MTFERRGRRPIRVLVADDDDLVRAALSDVLTADSRFTVVATTGDGNDLPDLVRSSRPDVVLLDVRMPSGGAQAVALVRDASATTGGRLEVVAISADTGTARVAAMLRAGVVGYLAKGYVGGTLPDLLARCARGEVVLAVPSAADALREVVRGTA